MKQFLSLTLPTVGRFFTLQKQIFGIMPGVQPRNSCRYLLKKITVSICSVPIHAVINELRYKESGNFSKKFI
jgi:hypothetical protein